MLLKWKRINDNLFPWLFLFCLGSFFFLKSCQQDLKEGCLDYRYVNFSVDADINCPDCCKLPELRILIRHRFFQNDSLYPLTYSTQPYRLSSGDTFFIENLSFILSDFHLVGDDNREIPSLDSIQIRTITSLKDSVFYTFTNSFLTGNPDFFQKRKVAAIFHSGNGVKGIKFQLGLNSIVSPLNPTHFPTGHPLANNQNYLFQRDKGYLFAHANVRWKDLSKNFPSNFILFGNEFNQVIELPVISNIRAGFHQEVTIEVDYAEWFRWIDFSKDSPEVIRKKWFKNLANSFKVVAMVEQID